MIEVIETEYQGYKFRSRLEARWAVFFTALKIEWEYETEGFFLRDGRRYLPDFYLPRFNYGGMYVEVKPNGGDFSKAIQFAADSKRSMWLAEGVPDTRGYRVYFWNKDTDTLDFESGIPNAANAFKENRMFVEPGFEDANGYVQPEEWECLGDHYVDAVKAAKQARFEHKTEIKFEYVPRKKQTSRLYHWYQARKREKQEKGEE